MKLVDPTRINPLNNLPLKPGPIVYWMSRDQRVEDNWALLYAHEVALNLKQPLVVLFCLQSNFLGANANAYAFMLAGLKEVKNQLNDLNIPFYLLKKDPVTGLTEFTKKIKPGLVVTDLSPLKISREWKKKITKTADFQFVEVDAHNIVPVWAASNKQEFGAYTLRPKLYIKLPQYLTDYPKLVKQNVSWNHPLNEDKIPDSKLPVSITRPGNAAAFLSLKQFISKDLINYGLKRNDPNAQVTSHLSAYFHFGQISAQRVALEVNSNFRGVADTLEAFLDELIVRRELADNYCLYNSNYDTFEGFPKWAKDTLNLHKKDKREFMYSFAQFENAETHDELWNACQMQMLTTGYMHGYMRMYWAKKILEWSKTPEDALTIAIKLNDTYELDGRDPNGYAGIAWAIGGVHDRAWFERPIFGKVRYMNASGAKRKFNVELYTQTWLKNK